MNDLMNIKNQNFKKTFIQLIILTVITYIFSIILPYNEELRSYAAKYETTNHFINGTMVFISFVCFTVNSVGLVLVVFGSFISAVGWMVAIVATMWGIFQYFLERICYLIE